MAKHETLWALNEYLRVIDDTPLNNKIIYKLMLATNISLKFEGYLKDESRIILLTNWEVKPMSLWVWYDTQQNLLTIC